MSSIAGNTGNTNPSIYIPRVFANIHWKRVKTIFEEKDIGCVDRVDMVNKENSKGEKYKRVFIHFKSWNDNENANSIRDKIVSGETVQFIYQEPWYWNISLNKLPKPDFNKDKDKKENKGKKDKKEKKSGKEKNNDKSEIAELKKMLKAQSKQMKQLQKMITTSGGGGGGGGGEESDK